MVRFLHAGNTQAIDDIFVNRFGKGIVFLKHHAHPPAQLNDINIGGVNVLTIQLDRTDNMDALNEIIHAVEAT